MPTAAETLAKFAAELQYSDLPKASIERAKDCMIDTIGISTYSSKLPWCRMVTEYAQRYGAGGPCSIIGRPEIRVQAPYAALANGVFAHAFEHDSFRDPSVGAHPGATLLPAVLAACEETGADGRTAIRAFVASTEVFFRVASALHFSETPPERLGFHAPGQTGPYGAAIAAGVVYGLNAEQLTNALGIAGSLSSGLLAFTKAKQGGMVKRLHMGRTAEAGILAARLAQSGYTGPETVLEGKFGFLEAYCRGGNAKMLTADLGKVWETERIGLKRYSCHMKANTPIEAVNDLMAEYKFKGADVAKIVVEGSPDFMHHPHITEPGDVGQAQYSVPFCVSLALFRDAHDPDSWDESSLRDEAIRALTRTVETRPRQPPGPSPWSTRVVIHLKDGRELARISDSVKGMLDKLMNREELKHKFMLTSKAMGEAAAAGRFDELVRLESSARFAL
jgi:2-methylcitrate dehydratase PrpD